MYKIAEDNTLRDHINFYGSILKVKNYWFFIIGDIGFKTTRTDLKDEFATELNDALVKAQFFLEDIDTIPEEYIPYGHEEGIIWVYKGDGNHAGQIAEPIISYLQDKGWTIEYVVNRKDFAVIETKELEKSINAMIKTFQRDASRLNRNANSIEEFKMWLKADGKKAGTWDFPYTVKSASKLKYIVNTLRGTGYMFKVLDGVIGDDILADKIFDLEKQIADVIVKRVQEMIKHDDDIDPAAKEILLNL